MTHIDFAILNSQVKVIYLRFTKSINFYTVKQRSLKWLHFPLLFILVCKLCLFSSKKTVIKIKLPLPEFYITKSVKRMEIITCRNVLKYILASDEESTRNLVLVILS